MVDIACDVQQVDETGYVWTFLDEARDPSVITTGAIVVAGDDDEPVFARVVDIVGSGTDAKVHLDVLPAAPERYLEAAARTRLSAR
jgi:hypothetical protein